MFELKIQACAKKLCISLFSFFEFYKFSLRANDLSNTDKFTCHSRLDHFTIVENTFAAVFNLTKNIEVFSIRADLDLFIIYLLIYLCVYFIEDHEDGLFGNRESTIF